MAFDYNELTKIKNKIVNDSEELKQVLNNLNVLVDNNVGKLSTWDNNGCNKSTWRYGKIMEEPFYEKGNNDNFENIDFNILPDKMTLNIRDLSNIENTETQSTQYKLGTTPSFLDE